MLADIDSLVGAFSLRSAPRRNAYSAALQHRCAHRRMPALLAHAPTWCAQIFETACNPFLDWAHGGQFLHFIYILEGTLERVVR